MTNRSRLSGLFAAITTPRTDRGSLDIETFDRHLELLLAAGVDGICLGGATSEYPYAGVDERQQLIRRAARRMPADRGLVVAIGATAVAQILDLAACAFEHGSRAVLLPMPIFFRYQQQDLYAYAASIGRRVNGPCLLYDLPDFTNPLAPETAINLLTTEPNFVGLKDSSGKDAHITCYAVAREGADWALLVGSDSLLRTGLAAGWDGSISGIASCCPELLVSLIRAHREGRESDLVRYQELLREFVAQIDQLPVPWGVRVALDVRGIDTGALPWPQASERVAQIARFRAWLPDWLARVGVMNWGARLAQ